MEDILFCIIDFETITPKGRPPEAIEMAGLKIMGNGVQVGDPFVELILPPGGVQLTTFDQKQMGLTESELLQAQPIIEVMEHFLAWIGEDDVQCLVAQHAPYEGAILYRYAKDHPSLLKLPLVDTIKLAKETLPHLPNYRLDNLAGHFDITIPKHRHRALPDVLLTQEIFMRLLDQARKTHDLKTLTDLLKLAEIKLTNQLLLI